MSPRTISLTDALRSYMEENSVREPPLLARLRVETLALGEVAVMQISPELGQLMTLLTRLMGARRVLEIGTFTGYSAICLASGLPPDGRLVACDINPQWAGIARRYWQEAGLHDHCDLRLGPALDTLAALRDEGFDDSFDIAFIDADRIRYLAYYEESLALLRQGGLIMVDNVLLGGKVADPTEQGEQTLAMRAFNSRLLGDERIDLSMVPIGDGLTLARKR